MEVKGAPLYFGYRLCSTAPSGGQQNCTLHLEGTMLFFLVGHWWTCLFFLFFMTQETLFVVRPEVHTGSCQEHFSLHFRNIRPGSNKASQYQYSCLISVTDILLFWLSEPFLCELESRYIQAEQTAADAEKNILAGTKSSYCCNLKSIRSADS